MAPPKPPRLLDQVREVARLKHFSLSTEKSYVHYSRDFILFHKKCHPKEMGADDDLYPCAQSGWARRAEPIRFVMNRKFWFDVTSGLAVHYLSRPSGYDHKAQYLAPTAGVCTT